MKEEIITIVRDEENNLIRDYLEREKDDKRLKDYYEFGINDFTNLITIERLIHEFNLGIEYNDKRLQDEFSKVINYLLDCSIG